VIRTTTTRVLVLGLALGFLAIDAVAAPPKVNPAARAALCKDSKPAHLKDCRDFCTAWPATRVCMLIRSEGRVVGDVWMTAAKLKISVKDAAKRVGVPQKHVPWLVRMLDTYNFLPIGWPQSGPIGADVKRKAMSAWNKLLRGNGLYREGSVNSAIVVITSARDELLAKMGPGHRMVGLASNNLANVLKTAGRHKEALNAATMAIAIDKASLPEFHGQTATAMWTRATIYEDMARPRDALADIEMAEKWSLESYGKEHPETASMQIVKARLLRVFNRRDDALATIKTAESTLAKLHGPSATKTLTAIALHASIASDMGDHKTAIALGTRNLAFRRAAHRPGHRDVTTAMHNLAVIYSNARRLAEARQMFEKVIPILERVDGPRFERLATSELLYGRTLRDTGQFMPAMKLLRRSYERRLKLFGPAAEDTIIAANDLVSLMARFGYRKDVAKLRLGVFQVMAKKYGRDHRQTARAAAQYAQALAADNKFKEAVSIAGKWLPKLRADGDGETVLLMRLSMGEWSLNAGDGKAARRSFDAAAKDLSAVASAEPRAQLQTRVVLADGYRRLGNLKAVRAQQGVIRELAGRQLGDGIDVAVNDVALFFTVHDLHSARSSQLQVAFEKPAQALDAVLFWQGLGSRAERMWRLLNGVAGAADAKTRADIKAYRRLVSTIGRLRPRVGTDAKKRAELKSAESKRDTLGKALAKRFAPFGRVRAMLHPSPKNVCRSLDRARASMVTYARWSKPVLGGESGKPAFEGRYTAVVTTRGCRTRVVHLGSAKDVDARINRWRAAIDKTTACINKRRKARFCKRDLKAMAAASTALRELVWNPVDKHLPKPRSGKKAPRTWLYPDGELVRVSFSALADAKGRYLVEDRELAHVAFPAAAGWAIGKHKTSASGAFVAGDIDYGRAASSADQAAASWRSCRDGKCLKLSAKNKGYTFNSEDIASVRGAKVCGATAAWQALPATEAPQIAAHLGQALSGRVTLADGTSVIEPALRRALPGTRVIHLATHGFFSPFKQCVDVEAVQQTAMAKLRQTSTKAALQSHVFDPLQLSAVVLSGANLGSKQGALRDGMMSGREVARMNLAGTELVVLSACETGLGEREAGEGSIGLARSFLLAGAEHVVTSLWQVPSRETGQLFEAFYPIAFAKRGQHPATALRQARLQLLASLRARRLPHNAWFWAAFQSVSNGI